MSWASHDEGEPPTQITAPIDAITTCGAVGTASLQHLHSLLATLAPLRAAYATAALERLHALPLEGRRILMPHVLRDHPDLARDPRIRVLAAEVGVDPDAAADAPDVVRWLARFSGVRADSAEDALERAERALRALSETVGAVAAVHHALGVAAGDHAPDALEVLVETLDRDRDRRALDGIAADARAIADVAREAAGAAFDEIDDLAALETRAALPSWWPRPFRDAALWARAVAERRDRARRAAVWAAALERALRAAWRARSSARRA